MRKALGHVLSAAVLAGSLGAPIPALCNEVSGNADNSEPIPTLVEVGNDVQAEAAEEVSELVSGYIAVPADSAVEDVLPQAVNFDTKIAEPELLGKGGTIAASRAVEGIADGLAHAAGAVAMAGSSEKDFVRTSEADLESVQLSQVSAEVILALSDAGEAAAQVSDSAEAEKAAEAAKIAEAEKAAEAAKIAEAEKAAEAAKIAEAEKAAEAAKIAEAEKAAEDGEKAESSSDAAQNEETANSAESAKTGEASAQEESGEKEAVTGSDGVNNSDSVEAAGDNKAAAPISPVFSGVVEGINDTSLSVSGQNQAGEPEKLEFIVDDGSQLAEGIKIGDNISVYYEVAESGGYRVTSARYVSGEAPKNVYPGDIPAKTALASGDENGDDNGDQLDSADVPKIVGIEVEGNKTVSSDEIMQILSIRIGDPLLEPRIRRDMQAIYDSGYYTDVRLDTRYTPEGVRVIFKVLENPVVNEIVLEGNQAADTDKLRSLMQLETGKVLNTRTLQNDMQAINKYYNEDLGYTITPSHISKLNFSDGKLTISLVDGIVVKEVKVEGVTVFPKEQIEGMITLKPGDLFNRNTLRTDTEKISKLYDDKQYILDTIKPSVDVETGVVTVNVVEAVLQEIKLVGNKRTKDDTIMRNLRTKPGEVMRRDRVQKDLERLNNLGLFKKVEPEVEPGSAPGQVILVLNIEEQKTGMATVGVGYAGGGSGAVRPGITGAISYSERNLFGEGKQISVNLQRGAQIGSYGISYYDPAINHAQDSLGVSVYYNSVDELEQQVVGADYGTYSYYDQECYGATVTYGHPFSDDLRGFITLRHETINVKMSGKSMYVPVGIGKGDLNAIGLAALYDTRDDVFNPHKGTYGNVAFTFAGLGGDYKYNKMVVEGRHYVPITKRSTLALRGMYGTVGTGSPASEYFYAGGTDTLRGYKDNCMFGNRLVLLNAEYRFPIGNIKMVSGAVFVDAGNAWINGYNDSRLYTDAGIGLRIVFPNLGLGVIRIDYAMGQEGSRTSIGIGQSF